MKRRTFAASSVLALAGAAALVAAGSASQPQPTGERGRDRMYGAWIPPGTYTAIILCSSGEDRRWTVSLSAAGRSVPIVVRPGENVVIPFSEGWTVNPGDEARLSSRLVPFDDAAKYNLVGAAPDYVISAWGITTAGPVEFVYRELK